MTREALDGWQLSGIVTHRSGAPGQVSLSVTGNPNITGGGDGARIALTCDPMHNAPKKQSGWFNNSCFTGVYAGAVGTAANPSGTQYSLPAGASFSPKVNFYFPGTTDFDTALLKNFPLNETGLKLQLRVETYNTFNHTQFSAGNAAATFNNAAVGTTPVASASDLGQMNDTPGVGGVGGPRTMQIALRVDF